MVFIRPFGFVSLLMLLITAFCAPCLRAQTPGGTLSPQTSPLLAPAAALPVRGQWQGTIGTGGMELRLVVHLVGENSDLSGTLDSPDQGAFGIIITSAKLTGQTLRFECESIKGTFEGTLGSDGQRVIGRWTQGGGSVPLTLSRQEKAIVQRRPQTPHPPFPYRSLDVTFPNPHAAGVRLAGTLILPPSAAPLPVVVFISGSGPNDRDETILNHKLFLVIADSLARRGIASLRYDKRGINRSSGNYAAATSVDFMSDALAAVTYLRGRREIDSRRIGLIGHSEGGMIAPMAAAHNRQIAFIVLLAGTGVNGREILLEQMRLIALADGASEAIVANNTRLQRQCLQIAVGTTDISRAQAAMRAAARANYTAFTAAQTPPTAPSEKALQELDQTADVQAKALLTPWVRFFLTYEPVLALRRVRCPVLVLNGSRDLQVSPNQNLPKIRAALQAGHNRRAHIEELPGLNHLFQTCKTGSPIEYARIEETFSPVALKIIGDWVVATTRQTNRTSARIAGQKVRHRS